MHSLHRLAASVIVLAALRSHPAAAQAAPSAVHLASDPILERLIQESLDARPELKQAQERVRAERERVPQAGALPDPVLSLGIQNDGFNGIQVGKMETSYYQVMLSQGLPWPGKLGLRTEVADLGARQAEAAVARAWLTTEADVRRAYLDLILTRERLGLLDRLESIWQKSAGVARSRYEAGNGPQSDVLRSQLELNRIRQRRWLLRAEERTAVQTLDRLRGLPLDRPLETSARVSALPSPTVRELEPAVQDGLARSPELALAKLGVTRAEAQARLARRERFPDLAPDLAVAARCTPRRFEYDVRAGIADLARKGSHKHLRRLNWGLIDPILIPAIAGGLGLLVGAIMLQLLGANPLDAYGAMAHGAFGSTNAFADTLVKGTPLLFVGIGTCIAYRCGVINIGGEGQMVIGAIFSTGVALTFQDAPAWFLVPASMVAGFVGGALWGGIAGVLKVSFRVNEVLSTIMLNAIAAQIMSFLLTGVLIDPTTRDNAIKIPQTQRLPPLSDLPRWIPTRLHLGVLIAIIMAVLVYVLLWRTTIGYRIRAVGYNALASRYAGISVNRYQLFAFILSGAFAGLAGAAELLGVTHRLFTDGSATGFTSNAGFNGIVAALFGNLHPVGTIPAAILFGALLVGANSLQRTVQVPSAFVTTLDGLIVVFVVASQIWIRRRGIRRLAAETTSAKPVAPVAASASLSSKSASASPSAPRARRGRGPW